MPVRKFYASSRHGALRAVKEAFGDRAIIISTRELDPSEWRPQSAGLRAIEIVAADDQFHEGSKNGNGHRKNGNGVSGNGAAHRSNGNGTHSVAKNGLDLEAVSVSDGNGSGNGTGNGTRTPTAAVPAALQRELSRIHNVLRSLTLRVDEQRPVERPRLANAMSRHLTAQGIASDFVGALLDQVYEEGSAAELDDQEWLEGRIRSELERFIPVYSLIDTSRERKTALAIVGPSGVGKSTLIAKIASYLYLHQDIPVRLGTLGLPWDPPSETLRIVASLLKVELVVLSSLEDVAALCRENSGDSKLLLDLRLPDSWADGVNNEAVSALGGCTNLETHLALSASMKSDDLLAMARSSQTLPASSLIFTKLDESRTVGNVFETLRQSRIPLSALSAGRRIPEDVEMHRYAGLLVDRILKNWRESI